MYDNFLEGCAFAYCVFPNHFVCWLQAVSKYKELFNKFVGEGNQVLSASRTHSILTKSRLPALVLAKIWELSDNDKYDSVQAHHTSPSSAPLLYQPYAF